MEAMSKTLINHEKIIKELIDIFVNAGDSEELVEIEKMNELSIIKYTEENINDIKNLITGIKENYANRTGI
jgi:hypothetical protein